MAAARPSVCRLKVQTRRAILVPYANPQAGFDHHLVKPVRLTSVLEVLAAVDG